MIGECHGLIILTFFATDAQLPTRNYLDFHEQERRKRKTASQREMSVKLDSSISSPMDRILRGPLQLDNNSGNSRGSYTEMQSDANSAIVGQFRGFSAFKGSEGDSIVPQGSVEQVPAMSSLLSAQEAHHTATDASSTIQKEFKEQERFSTDARPNLAVVSQQLHSGSIATFRGSSKTDTISHTNLCNNSQSQEGGSTESWLPSGTSDTNTIHRSDTTENREQSLAFTIAHPYTRDATSHSQHSLSASATLPQHTPQAHAATAADIALGISSEARNLEETNRLLTRNQQVMGSHELRGQANAESMLARRSKEEASSAKDDTEDTSRTSRSETGAVSSPGTMTPLHYPSGHGEQSELPTRLHAPLIGTPSTVSTAPSSDDASLGNDYKLDDSMLPQLLHMPHQRSPSWDEEGLFPGPSLGLYTSEGQGNTWMQAPAPAFAAQQTWGEVQHPHQQAQQQQQQRVASFRNGPMEYGYPPDSRGDRNWPQQQPQGQHHRHFSGEPQLPFLPQHGRGMSMDPRQAQQQLYNQQQEYGPQPTVNNYQQVPRKSAYAQHGPPPGQHEVHTPNTTPPRNNPRNPRPQGQNPHRQTPTGAASGTPHQSSSTNPSRSSSEILKTLLRKKACLYEPDTSRAVALVTWLVGSELALEYGFFSRQQLQSGVHACVADKIDSGAITRTKVNRCMQIILNSCFHYIIPRSDGTEEKGDSFRAIFAQEVQDSSFLLQYLPVPWNDLEVKKETVILASLNDGEEFPPPKKALSTPKSSPKLTSVNADRSPGRDSTDDDNTDSKRAVLLCFNENVRSAEDVFRCHNEFIRDTANASHLQLSAQEWRTFFGREAARAPFLWGNVGIPMLTVEVQGGPARQPDFLGQMSHDEAGKFRTTWCTKRYDHDHELCGFAHVEVNNGWLRRNPASHDYQEEMCKYISTSGDKRVGPNFFVVNECPKGTDCDYTHSLEEIVYHPNRYKVNVCSSTFSRSGGCTLGDVCPNLHPSDSTRPIKKSSEGRSHTSRHGRKNDQQLQGAGTKGATAPPISSPVIYASPAPFSSFERQLAMPGLQNLFRRHSSVIRAHVRTSGKCKCCYSYFGDDWGIGDVTPSPKSRTGLPPTRRV